MNDIITVTPNAWEKIHNKLEAAGTEFKSVKVGITTKGCSGHSYKFNIIKEEPTNLEKFVKDGDHYVVIEPYAEMFLTGATLDYIIRDKFTQGLDFVNNREISRSGCGESFNIT